MSKKTGITSIKKPTVSLSRNNYKFTLSFGNIDSNAEKIKIVRTLTTYASASYSSGSIAVGISASTDKTYRISASKSSWSYTINKDKYYPFKTDGNCIEKLTFEVLAYTTKGGAKKDKTVKSKTATKTYKFGAAKKPTVDIYYSDDGTSLTYSVDINDDYGIDDNTKNVCTRAKVWLYSETYGQSRPSLDVIGGSEGTWYNSDVVKNISNKITGQLDASIPVRYTISAFGAGPGGQSQVVSASHVMARPYPSNKPTAYKYEGVGDGCYHVSWNTTQDSWHPVDSVTIQYRDQSEYKDAADYYGDDMGSWNNAKENIYSYMTGAATNDLGAVNSDNVRYFRILSIHDGVEVPSMVSEPIDYGVPSNASSITVDVKTVYNSDGTTKQVPVFTWTNSSTKFDDAQLLIYSSEDSNNPIKVIEYGSDIWVAQTFVYSEFNRYGQAIKYGFRVRVGGSRSSAGIAQSDILWTNELVIPNKCGNLKAKRHSNNTTVELTWDNPVTTDTVYNGIDVAWSTMVTAWESNSTPSTASFDNGAMSRAYITGLTEGSVYYFWVRLFDKQTDGTVNYGIWSDPSSGILLADSPDTPVLTSSRSWVKEGGNFAVQWDYVASDNLPQARAEVSIRLDGTETWRVVGSVEGEETKCTIDLSEKVGDAYTYTAGKYQLKVDVYNSVGSASSETIYLTVAKNPTCAITATSLTTSNVDSQESDSEETTTYTETSLTALPLTLTATGDGTLNAYLYCAESFDWMHPDFTDTIYAGDCVWAGTIQNGSEYSIESVKLANNCLYRLQVECVDETTGLSATPEYVDFRVRWAHQASEPTGSTVVINDEDHALLTPVKPVNAADTDVCDIYRVTSDGRYLCHADAAWGVTIEDTLPTFGDMASPAYCFCTRTSEHDENWVDVAYVLKGSGAIIDYGGESVALPWNMSISDDRTKQGEIRAHLGGTKRYFGQAYIERKNSITADVVKVTNQDLIEYLYDISRYTGVCYVRTSDGIGYPAVVDVSISKEYNNKIVSVSINATETDDVDQFYATTSNT